MSSVKVYLRIRPESKNSESSKDTELGLENKHQRPRSLDPLYKPGVPINVQKTQQSKRCIVRSDKRHFNERYFDFEDIFEEEASQENVFHTFKQKLLDSALNGVNFCLMNYGQTSAGKTYTLFGEEGYKKEGLVPRFVKALFERLNEEFVVDENRFRVKTSFFEIYKEKLFDLSLEEGKETGLAIRENSKRGTYVHGLQTEQFVDSAGLLEQLNEALARRRINETAMNDRSSRSHFVFTLTVETDTKIDCGGGEGPIEVDVRKSAKLVFVDLAGSERQVQKNVAVMQEGCSINRSLSVLQHVIGSLSHRASKDFVHFRDSKLTYFLKDIFVGNSEFAILGNIRRPKDFLIHSLNTLNFVSQAKSVKTNPQINFEAREHRSQLALSDLTVMLNGLGIKSGESDGKTEFLKKEINQLTRVLGKILAIMETRENLNVNNDLINVLKKLANDLESEPNLQVEEEQEKIAASLLSAKEVLNKEDVLVLDNLQHRIEKSLKDLQVRSKRLEENLRRPKRSSKFISRNPSPPFGKKKEHAKTQISYIDMPESAIQASDFSSDRDFSAFLQDNFEKDKSTNNEERRLDKIRDGVRKVSGVLLKAGLLGDPGSIEEEELKNPHQLELILKKTLEDQKISIGGTRFTPRFAPERACFSDALTKRINNLERQLRNRNKDYLFALKEIEKLKVGTLSSSIDHPLIDPLLGQRANSLIV